MAAVGEFDDIDDDARRDASSSETARQSPSSDASSGPGPSSSAAPARPAREWRVRARRELTEELILEEVGGIEGKNAGRVLALHSLMREEARLHARRLRHLADFFAIDPDNEGSLIDADMTAMKVAVGLRPLRHAGHLADPRRPPRRRRPAPDVRAPRGRRPAGGLPPLPLCARCDGSTPTRSA
ncbi:hypothetical protein [Brachybacterium sp. GPGPB12]|uniref:hypothetical protein n=1 Tax=Brachybacterium sp. GPGPB12 TaxID=3023517 RepID=UPI00313463F8